ncbi:hypothetical protein [Legionella tunisiensis]|uniref:hypothetical protein n=1 Tax=Legionella tunisiensis TaxID=1034944 RepID=UPI0002DDAD89|nr:hypothetical protein [Legionella tunisiensis]
MESIIQFGAFKVPSIDLSFSDWETLEERDLMGSSWIKINVEEFPHLLETEKSEDHIVDDQEEVGILDSVIIVPNKTEISRKNLTGFINALGDYLSTLEKEPEIWFLTIGITRREQEKRLQRSCKQHFKH